jgi:hypothetical protein
MTSNCTIPVVEDDQVLLRYGICRVPLPLKFDATEWAMQLSQITPAIMAAEGDNEYAFYRNILEEPDFPFASILESEIGAAILRHFAVSNLDDIRLDDAFCVHYNMSQHDTSGSRHKDPSDITVNLCLEKSEDAEGSQVLFYGTQVLHSVEGRAEDIKEESFRFLVDQHPMQATVHWGNHIHQTTKLERGTRTNVVLTYCYVDQSKSDVSSRTCYL